MQFRTPIPILKTNFPIDYNSKIGSIGSCFAVNIADKLDYYKFQNYCNPFGIIFNPVAIEKLVDRVVNQVYFTEKDIFFHNDLWHCFEVHSELSNPNKEAFLDLLNQLVDDTNRQIIKSTHFLITYGTSWVYRDIETKQIVANCHKVPQKQFSKELLSIECIEKAMQNTITLIQQVNPEVKFIFTVSPVRHIKDGFVENQQSKAHLISGIHKVLNTEHCKLNTAYFPSYEILLDELRDYRFYAEDMLHPNAIAIDYIWQRFKETTILETDWTVMEEVEAVQKSLSHRPFNPQSESHQKFLDKLQKRIGKLSSKYPFMKF
jgi:hypothetical protein